MSEELIEELARVLDAYDPNRIDRELCLRQARALLPIIHRLQLEAGEKVREAAARENLMICLTNGEELTDEAMEMLNFAADRIRALDVAAIIGDSYD